MKSAFESLSHVLYGGDAVATDFKTAPGTNADFSRDELAQSLLDSMKRVGLIVDGNLFDPNAPTK